MILVAAVVLHCLELMILLLECQVLYQNVIAPRALGITQLADQVRKN